MIFIPGMKPGHVSGAAGSRSKTRGGRLTFGSAYRGKATPRNLVPYEEPRRDDGRKARAAKAARAQDVADALHYVRDAPNSARERINHVQRDAETVPV